ncbi:hypothetical protein GCM10009718_30160 [Isoptericola halotolerans]
MLMLPPWCQGVPGCRGAAAVWDHGTTPRQPSPEETAMSKRGSKRRGRKSKAANHGKRPNA